MAKMNEEDFSSAKKDLEDSDKGAASTPMQVSDISESLAGESDESQAEKSQTHDNEDKRGMMRKNKVWLILGAVVLITAIYMNTREYSEERRTKDIITDELVKEDSVAEMDRLREEIIALRKKRQELLRREGEIQREIIAIKRRINQGENRI